MQIRIGNGYDVHRFDAAAQADACIHLGGVAIPHSHRLVAHSDGDVLLHSLCDAMLGALALGDLGHHFPDNDARFHNISSMELLGEVWSLVQDKGWHLLNADMTIVAQAPRVAPHIAQMRSNIAGCCQTAVEQISIKATTTEGLGFTGRGEGIACYTVVLLGHGPGRD